MYATEGEVAARLGRDLTVGEVGQVQAMLRDASALVDGYLGRVEPFDVVPAAVSDVVARMVVRALTSEDAPEGVSTLQQSSGPYARTFTYAGEGSSLWLGAAEKMMLRPWRLSAVSVPLVSDRGQHG